MEKLIQLCPFRGASVTEQFLTQPGSYTRTTFETCLKEKCPAYELSYADNGDRVERCKRLK